MEQLALKHYLNCLCDALDRMTQGPQHSNVETWQVKHSPHVSNVESCMENNTQTTQPSQNTQTTQPSHTNSQPSSSTQSCFIEPSPSKDASESDPAFASKTPLRSSSPRPSLMPKVAGPSINTNPNRLPPRSPVPQAYNMETSSPLTRRTRESRETERVLTPDLNNLGLTHREDAARVFRQYARFNRCIAAARQKAKKAQQSLDIGARTAWLSNLSQDQLCDAEEALLTDIETQKVLKCTFPDLDQVETIEHVWAQQGKSITIVMDPSETWSWPKQVNLPDLLHIVLDNGQGTKVHCLRTNTANEIEFVTSRVVIEYSNAKPFKDTLKAIFESFPVKFSSIQDADHLRMKHQNALTISGDPRVVEPAVLTSKEFNTRRTSKKKANPAFPISDQNPIVDRSLSSYHAHALAHTLNHINDPASAKNLMKHIHPDIQTKYVQINTAQAYVESSIAALANENEMLDKIYCPENSKVATVLCYELKAIHDQESQAIKKMVRSVLTDESITNEDKVLVLNTIAETSLKTLDPVWDFFESTMRRAQSDIRRRVMRGPLPQGRAQVMCDVYISHLMAELQTTIEERINALKVLITECKKFQTRAGHTAAESHIPQFAEVKLQDGKIDSLIARWELLEKKLPSYKRDVLGTRYFNKFVDISIQKSLPNLPFNKVAMEQIDLHHRIQVTPNNRGLVCTNRNAKQLLTLIKQEIQKANQHPDGDAYVSSINTDSLLTQYFVVTVKHLDDNTAELKVSNVRYIQKPNPSKDSTS
uniref:hypothetical protein n=1 Tax=Streptosarcina costaricana TaxID=2058783 RepID=UPI00286C29FB|nr:hypothetical protein RMD91_pgp033 [Streptosarcina costaricana]YP_010933555.1 hypothetical protein RMD91_pgp008 [Streptosarcina costaricana]WKT08904.1 hypothetical protein [Streptosarcina costaricana]WKT08905.1 hypothetical protein [Streptosarcina costaricana]